MNAKLILYNKKENKQKDSKKERHDKKGEHKKLALAILHSLKLNRLLNLVHILNPLKNFS